MSARLCSLPSPVGTEPHGSKPRNRERDTAPRQNLPKEERHTWFRDGGPACRPIAPHSAKVGELWPLWFHGRACSHAAHTTTRPSYSERQSCATHQACQTNVR